VVDLHSHVLPGLDDGASDLEQAVAMCRAAAADGIEILAATPHVRADHPTTPEQMESGLRALRTVAGDIVQLVAGGEIALAELERPLAELTRFGLGGNPRFLLVETPYVGWPLDLAERLFRLRVAGITPVLAHPERSADVQLRPELLEPIVAGGTLVQLTAGAVDGRLGRRARACCEVLLERGLAHLVASDAHEPSVRAIGLSSAARALGDGDLAAWLTDGTPRAIVDDAPLPPRPSRTKRRGFFERRG
jgi:protein-tyrosine phosphatase